uniref:Uncharacterized protein n=1 Tax=Siphoviridae sp. ctpoI7 TaxID=2825678 RepID=A0A8S5PAR2_9CAUD|nr:MAG TPA: hypothetical protein [Siphoviridae sp. ctpoI7]
MYYFIEFVLGYLSRLYSTLSNTFCQRIFILFIPILFTNIFTKRKVELCQNMEEKK